MSSFTYTYSFTNGTVSDASQVNKNFDDVRQYIATEVITRDGTVAMTGQLSLPSNPSADQHASRKAYVDSVMPIGMVMPYAGAAAPNGFLLCTGLAVSRVTYSALFTAIGTAFGVGDNSTTFNIPDLRGRVVTGPDNMGGSNAGRVGGMWALGQSAGEHQHVLTYQEMPAHDHGINSIPNFGSYENTFGIGSLQAVGGYWYRTSVDGNSQPHNNMQPYQNVNYLIRTGV